MRLRILRRLNDRIGLQEASDHRVVKAPVHVNEAELIQVLMPREAALSLRELVRCRGAVSRVAPWAKAMHKERPTVGVNTAGEGELGDHAAQMVGED